MGIKIPKNLIVTGKYTIGEEYVLLSSHIPYQGYYYELNGKTFAGKEFNNNSPEIVKMISDKFNSLLGNPKTSTYAKIAKTKLNSFIPNTKIYVQDYLSTDNINRYFIKKINVFPILIKEVTEESFNKALSDPLYVTVVINWDRGGYDLNINKIDAAEKIMPGIKAYLEDEKEDVGDNASLR